MAKRKGFSNRTRGAAYGICIGIFMVIFAALLSVPNADAGCAGDCMTCHQNLEASPEHQPLKTCIQCHEASSEKNIAPFMASADGCGTRCFDCHNQWPADVWHQQLDSCSKCHIAPKSFLSR